MTTARPAMAAFGVATLLLFIWAAGVMGAEPSPQLILQNGHTRDISVLAYHPKGRIFASGSDDHTVRLWDGKSGRLLAVLSGHKEAVSVLAFSPDGRVLASGAEDIRLWNTESGSLLRNLGPVSSTVRRLLFTPDGKTLVSQTAFTTVVLWDVDEGKIRPYEDPILSPIPISLSPTGETLATASSLWEVPEGRIGISPPYKGVSATAWSADGRVLYTARGKSVELRDGRTGAVFSEFPQMASEIEAIAAGPKGRLLAVSAKDGTLQVWDAESSRKVRSWASGLSGVRDLRFDPEGKMVVASGPKEVFLVGMHEVENGKPAKLPAPRALAFGPSGKVILTRGPSIAILDGEELHVLNERPGAPGIMDVAVLQKEWGQGRRFDQSLVLADSNRGLIWDLEGGTFKQTLPMARKVRSVAASPDGKLFATAEEGAISLRDGLTGVPLTNIKDEAEVSCLAFSPDGGLLAAGAGKMGKVWNLREGRMVAVLRGHEKEIRGIAFSPDGLSIVTASLDNSLKTWDLGGRLLSETPGRTHFIWASKPQEGAEYCVLQIPGFTAVGTGEGVTDVWDVEKGKNSLALQGHTGAVLSLTADPALQHLATGGEDGVAVLWDLATGRRLAELRGHTSSVTAIRFLSEGRVVMTAGLDDSIRFWDLKGHPLAVATVLPGSTDWIAVSPEGFFDGSPAATQMLLWRLSDDILDVADPEQYFSEFYQPGLLRDILRQGNSIPEILRGRGDTRAGLNISKKDRRLPTVGIWAPKVSRKREIKVRVEVREAPRDEKNKSGSGIRDVRLFRNGTLIRRWDGERGNGELSCSVPIEAGQNRLTAYAFNRDNIKSKDAVFVVTGDENLMRHAEAHVLCIGINRYARSENNLNYAVADAKAMAAALKRNLPQEKAGHVRVLLDEAATRSGIIKALREVVKTAQPEDTVIVSFSGHGLLEGEHFYLIPHDAGTGGKTLARRSISDKDLEEIFLGLQARRSVLILDACHSGQALESDEWRRGPLNARGLAQLAWEKGMDILAASQGRQAALEAWQINEVPIGHGLLTYALVEEGFSNLAPWRGNWLMAKDWLEFAAARVPQLLGDKGIKARAIRLGTAPSESPVQTPRIFHRREVVGEDWPVAAKRSP